VEEWSLPPGSNRSAGLQRVVYTIPFATDHAANQVHTRPTPSAPPAVAGGASSGAAAGDASDARMLAPDTTATTSQYVSIALALAVPSTSVDGDDARGGDAVARQNATVLQMKAAIAAAFPSSSLQLPPAAQGFASAAVDALVLSGMPGTTSLYSHGAVVTGAALPSLRPAPLRPSDAPAEGGAGGNRVAVIGAVLGAFLAITAVVVVAVALRRAVVKARKRRGMTLASGGRDGSSNGPDSVRNPIRLGLAHAAGTNVSGIDVTKAADGLDMVAALAHRQRKPHRPWLTAFVGGTGRGDTDGPAAPPHAPDAEEEDDDGMGLRPHAVRGVRSGPGGKWPSQRRPVHASDVLLSVQPIAKAATDHGAHPADAKRATWEAGAGGAGQTAAGTGLVNATNCIAMAAIGQQASSMEGDWWDSGGEEAAGEGGGGADGGNVEPADSETGSAAADGEDDGVSNPKAPDVVAAAATAAASAPHSNKSSRPATPSSEPAHVHAPPSVLFRPHALRALPPNTRGRGILSPGTGFAAATAAYAHRNMDAMMGDSDDADSDTAPRPPPVKAAAVLGRGGAATVNAKHANIPLYEPRTTTAAAATPSVTATLAAALSSRGALPMPGAGVLAGAATRRGRHVSLEDADAAAAGGGALAAGTRIYNPLTVGRYGAPPSATGVGTAAHATAAASGDQPPKSRQHSGALSGSGAGSSFSHVGSLPISRGRSAASQPPSREHSDGVAGSRVARSYSNVSVGSTASAFHSPSPRSRISSEHALSTTALVLPPPALLRQSTADKLVLRVPDGGKVQDSSDDDDGGPLPTLPAARRGVQSMAVARSSSFHLAPGALPSWGSAGSVMHAPGPSLIAGGPSAYSRALMAAAGGSTDSLPTMPHSGSHASSRKPVKPAAPHPDRHQAPVRQSSGSSAGASHSTSATALSALGVSASASTLPISQSGSHRDLTALGGGGGSGGGSVLTAHESAALEAASQRFHTYRHPSISSECERTSKHGHPPRSVGGGGATGAGTGVGGR